MRKPQCPNSNWLVAVGVALVVGGCGVAPEEAGFDHADFDAVLMACVHGEGVDYPLLREGYRPRLDAYVERFARLDIETLERDDALAALINLYNAAVLQAVAERFEPGYTVAEGEFALFEEPRIELGGERISLDHLEHEIIRPRFGEPRIHVALVCAARSCPPLAGRAFVGHRLETALEERMFGFLDDETRNVVDHEARRLRLSRLFEWFAEDFGGADALATFVDRYVDADVAGYDRLARRSRDRLRARRRRDPRGRPPSSHSASRPRPAGRVSR
jgi:hypothetical protein